MIPIRGNFTLNSIYDRAYVDKQKFSQIWTHDVMRTFVLMHELFAINFTYEKREDIGFSICLVPISR